MPQYGLDIAAAASVLRGELYGDWYRDPWGWPEFRDEFVATLGPADIGIVRADGGLIGLTHAPFFQAISMPKQQLGTRPAVNQDPASRLAYTAASLAVAKPLHESLADWVFGWRFRDGDLAHSTTEWKSYQDHARSVIWYPHSLQTDITSYFASLDVEKFIAYLLNRSGNTIPVRVISQVLRAHDSLAGRRGFPQRSSASAFLANIALRPIDDAISTALSSGRVSLARRWMDDISAEGDESQLFRLFLEIQTGARQVGLELNSSKTGIYSGDEILTRINAEDRTRVEPMSLREALNGDYVDEGFAPMEHGELLELEDELLNDPDHASRSDGKLVLRSLREYGLFSRLADWLAVAERLPHLADSLGRYFAEARLLAVTDSEQIEGWFLAYAESSWSRLDWARAQHALAFSSDDTPPPIVNLLWRWLESATDVQTIAVATQRLARRDPGRFRSTVRQRLDAVADPLLLRVLSFGLVVAQDSREVVRATLARSPHTALSLKYLEFVNWDIPDSPTDFDRAP